MYDPNIKDFYERVGRLQKAHASGMGFEAVGTLGRSYSYRPKARKRFSLVAPAIFVTFSLFGLKGTIHYHVGSDIYQARVEALKVGEGFDRLGAVIMAADPVTLWVSAQLHKYL